MEPRSGVEPDCNRSAGDCVAVPPPWLWEGYIHIIDNKIIYTGGNRPPYTRILKSESS